MAASIPVRLFCGRDLYLREELEVLDGKTIVFKRSLQEIFRQRRPGGNTKKPKKLSKIDV